MGQGVTSDWGHAAMSQPVLDGASLVGVAICSNGWLHHGGLHTNHHSMEYLLYQHQIIECLLSKGHLTQHLLWRLCNIQLLAKPTRHA